MNYKHTEEFKKSRLREGNPAWNGGISIDSNGYVRILNSKHKYADTKGYVKEHILIWYEYNGYIPEGYCIHHKNGNKKDNDIHNLELLSVSEHSSLHLKGNKFGQKYSDYIVLNWVNLHYDGLTYESIAKKIKIDKSTIFRRIKEFKKMYPRPKWACQQIFRESGLLEDICKDNHIGHPNIYWLKKYDPDGKLGFGIHGCDGCCSKQEI